MNIPRPQSKKIRARPKRRARLLNRYLKTGFRIKRIDGRLGYFSEVYTYRQANPAIDVDVFGEPLQDSHFVVIYKEEARNKRADWISGIDEAEQRYFLKYLTPTHAIGRYRNRHSRKRIVDNKVYQGINCIRHFYKEPNGVLYVSREVNTMEDFPICSEEELLVKRIQAEAAKEVAEEPRKEWLEEFYEGFYGI